MNIIEHYQKHYPDLPDEQLLHLIANEAFLRRVSAHYNLFMLKGSFVSRVYFEDIGARLPNDLDFVYFGAIKDPQKAELIFTEWADKITQTHANDGVSFQRFSKHALWEGVEYQMHQDFPTVSSFCYVDVLGSVIEIDLDISFNLELLDEPVEILYPNPHDVIYLPYSVPLSIQIAWKIHQCIVNPRFKDFYDLAYLAPLLTRPHDIHIMIETLKNECQRDKIPTHKIKQFFSYHHHDTFKRTVYHNGCLKNLSDTQYYNYCYDELKVNCTHIPNDFDKFWRFYADNIKNAPFNKYLAKFWDRF